MIRWDTAGWRCPVPLWAFEWKECGRQPQEAWTVIPELWELAVWVPTLFKPPIWDDRSQAKEAWDEEWLSL